MTDNYVSLLNRINDDAKGSFYLFDIGRLYAWYDMLSERLKTTLSGRASFVYAIKANPFLTEYMDKKVESFEVCSPGEFEICLKKNIKTEKIVFSGVYKSKESITRIFECGFEGIVTLESRNHYRLLLEVMDEMGINSVTILPRLSSGNKFGMDEDTIVEIISDALKDKRLTVAGIQYFSGTQKKKIKVIHEELEKIDQFCDRIKSETGFSVEFVEYGPGFFYDYYSLADHTAAFEEVIDEIRPYIEKYRFALESGRFLSASCGDFVTQIVDIKKTFDKNYCLVDGGIHHVNYYGRMLGMNVPKVSHIGRDGEVVKTNEAEEYEIGGALCTVSDVLLKNFPLTNPKEGDLLVFHDTGAYSCTESSVLFLSRKMPLIYALEEDETIKLLRDAVESCELNS